MNGTMNDRMPAAARVVLQRQSTPSTSNSAGCKDGDTACEFLGLIASPFSSEVFVRNCLMEKERSH